MHSLYILCVVCTEYTIYLFIFVVFRVVSFELHGSATTFSLGGSLYCIPKWLFGCDGAAFGTDICRCWVLDRNEDDFRHAVSRAKQSKANKESNGSQRWWWRCHCHGWCIECILSVHVKRPNSLALVLSVHRYMHTMCVFVLYLSQAYPCTQTHTRTHIGIRAAAHGSHPVVCMRLFVRVPVWVYAMLMMILFLLVEIHTCCRIHSHPYNKIHYWNRKNDQNNAATQQSVHASQSKREQTNGSAKKRVENENACIPSAEHSKICDLMCIWGDAQQEFWVVNNNNEPETTAATATWPNKCMCTIAAQHNTLARSSINCSEPRLHNVYGSAICRERMRC